MRVVNAFLLVAAACSAQNFPFDVKTAGEVVAYLSVEAPKADWGVRGREASVLALRVDNGAVHHLMTWGGPYRVFLGRLDAGRHELVVAANNNVPFKVTGVRFEERPEPEFEHAPILYARADTVGKFSDVPLVMYAERVEGSLMYTVVFSNEDGGTSTRALMARWGRTTDIEYVYRVWPEQRKSIVQGKDHEDQVFTGPFEGSHPVLIPFTKNNMVQGASAKTDLRFQLAPILIGDLAGSRERVMDSNPATYSAMTRELVRENKLRPPGVVDGQKISDPRNYLYVEYDAKHDKSAMTVSATLKDGRVFASDLGRLDYAITRDGPVRTTIELPPGTTPAAIARLTFSCLVAPPPTSKEPLALAGTCTLQRVRQAFFLNTAGLPGKSFLSHAKEYSLPTGRGVVIRP